MDTFWGSGSSRVWGAAGKVSFSPPNCGYTELGASVESEKSSEDYENYISCLAEEVAQAMLEDEDVPAKMSTCWGVAAPKPAWNSQLASSPTSPQSILATTDGYNWELTSPDGVCSSDSGFSSPPTPVAARVAMEDDAAAHVVRKDDGFDFLYTELVRLKLESSVKACQQKQTLSRQQQIIRPPAFLLQGGMPIDTLNSEIAEQSVFSACSPAHMTQAAHKPEGYSRSRGKCEDQSQFRGGGIRKQAAVWAYSGPAYQQSYNYGGGNGNGSRQQRGAWEQATMNVQQHQHQHHHHQHFSLFASNGQGCGRLPNDNSCKGSGMRAVFLGTPGSRECGGTGVFLPRRLGCASDSKRKPACSTVLLPSRIVHALNLNIEDTLPSPVRRDVPSSHSVRRNAQFPALKSDESPLHLATSRSTTLQQVAPDVNLPTEWTY